MLESNVEIELGAGGMRKLTVNGHSMTIMRASLDLGSRIDGRAARLTLELPVLQGRIHGMVSVEIANALPGSTLQRDDKGRLWIVPKLEPFFPESDHAD